MRWKAVAWVLAGLILRVGLLACIIRRWGCALHMIFEGIFLGLAAAGVIVKYLLR